MQIIKGIYACAFCSAWSSSKGCTVNKSNDESSREGFTFVHFPFLLCQGFFSHPIMQLPCLHTPYLDASGCITYCTLTPHFTSFFLYPSTLTPPEWHQTSHPHHPLEILNTVQLWCFNTALNWDHYFTAAQWQSQLCCTSIPLHCT